MRKKFIFIHVIAVSFFLAVGYFAGKMTAPGCSQPVLGVQTPDSLLSRMALFFTPGEILFPNLSPIPLDPAVKPTHVPIIKIPTIAPDLIHINFPPSGEGDAGVPPDDNAGLEENPTPVPKTPAADENTASGGNQKTVSPPSPTPQYYLYPPTATPTIDTSIPDQEMMFPDDTTGHTKETSSSATTPEPVLQQPFNADQIKRIINLAGISMEKPEIMMNIEVPGLTIKGTVKDKIFGVFPISYPVTIHMDASTGQIKSVDFPWWRKLFGNPLKGVISQVPVAPTDEPVPTKIPTPSIDSGQAVDDEAALVAMVKASEVARVGAADASAVTYSVSQIQGKYARGMVSATAGGAGWFAAKVNGTWKLVFIGNGTVQCSQLADYPDFPNTMIPECWDEVNQKNVIR